MSEENLKTVLVAEDEQDISSALEMVLSDTGFKVVMAADGEEAMEKFFSEKPDIILLDINMPKMTGVEVLAQIRQQEGGQNIPVTILTASDTMGFIADVTSIGGEKTDFLSKTDASLEDIAKHVQDRVGQ